MLKNWEELIESREQDITFTGKDGKKQTKRGQSTWKQELVKITTHEELLDLFEYLQTVLKKDVVKFYNKKNKAAGRRARNYAQKIKDTMLQVRIIIQKHK